ncbi:jasmonate-induced oxygenase 4 isoform X2 [Prosopis cineraria]|uniref:jasmonate-induced oxygenase 4 isoform X2 n=1 Tax=Prosopis cineraria TaxID=364024 RepID=UPI00240FC5F1|nr:jasmonate-induced oxygenase 4 isoform X2 [Prosopis cineraria]
MEVCGDVIRVQALAQSGVSQVPPQYIQFPENRPIHQDPCAATTSSSFTDSDADIPVVNLFGFDPDQKNSVREAIRRACREWGAFHVKNHGVPVSLLDDIRRVGLTFFNDCPMSEKLRYACDSSSAASEGYGSRMLQSSDQQQNDAVQILDWRDYFDHHSLPLSRRNPSRWPSFPSDYREVVTRYSDEMKVLAQKLSGLISESLGLRSSCIEDAVGDFYQNITISYYPPCPQPELTLGLQAHSDMGAITLLIQDDVGGLQVLKDGAKWVTVKPLSEAILVLLADQTEFWTRMSHVM